MLESAMTKKLVKVMESVGAWTFKVWGGGMQTSGMSDLIVVWKTATIFVEVKRLGKGRVSALQRSLLRKIWFAGGLVCILWIDDDGSSVIECPNTCQQIDMKMNLCISDSTKCFAWLEEFSSKVRDMSRMESDHV